MTMIGTRLSGAGGLAAVLVTAFGAACSPLSDDAAENEGEKVVSQSDPLVVGGTCRGGGGNRGDLFLNPFDMLSAHHRPIGDGAEAGIPGSTTDPRADNPVYSRPGALNVRGKSLDNVKRFRTGSTEQGRKFFYRVAPSDPFRTVRIPGDPSVRLRMPNATYPSNDGDSVVVFWPRNGASGAGADIADLFFNYDGAVREAKSHRSFGLAGTDIAYGTDGGEYGTGASRLRQPTTVLRGFEINSASPAPIRHALNVTATRHGREGAPKAAHVLSDRVVWPAFGTDGSADQPGENLGDLPYGTRLFIRSQDRALRDTLKLTPRGKALFDTLTYYGVYIIDGQGAHEDGGGVLQLRIDQDVSADSVKDLDEDLQKMLRLMYPLRNPRPHDQETEISRANGLPYAGGGGPLLTNSAGAGSCNNAWNAPVKQ